MAMKNTDVIKNMKKYGIKEYTLKYTLWNILWNIPYEDKKYNSDDHGDKYLTITFNSDSVLYGHTY